MPVFVFYCTRSPEEEVWVFGVFDGHGGKMVSNMSAPTVLRCFQRHPRVTKSRGGRGGGAQGSRGKHAVPKMLVEGMHNCFGKR